MKYYIINSEGKEASFDLSVLSKSVSEKYRRILVSQSEGEEKEYLLRQLAGKNYISKDNQYWEKLPATSASDSIVNANDVFKVYRGYKPSGLGQANAGNLVTDMPGKVIKVLTSEGAVVSEGDTLVILEAMKMENEIKSGIDGVVKTVHVQEGEVLESGKLMIEIEE